LLPTRYVHAVFTLPRELAPLALQNKRLIYGLLFRTSAATLLEIAALQPPSLRHNLNQRHRRSLSRTRTRPTHSGFVQVGFSSVIRSSR
jgi:hypothetical protein